MRRALLVIVLVLAGQVLPSLASPSSVIRPQITSIAIGTQSNAALTNERMVAVTWRSGTPQVTYRWHLPSGWTSWHEAEDDSAASPQGTPGTAPLWRPAQADRIEVRIHGATEPRLIKLYDGHARLGLPHAQAQTGRALLGTVHSRAAWGADESIRRGSPSYAARVEAVVIHHTANANGYAAKDVPAVIRADYAYHVQTRGWSDLGYNLLVDAYGGIWEGRAGGLGKATVGAHAEGFNTATLGVALIGDLTQAAPTKAAERALARAIAYAASTWRFAPTASTTLTSRGSPRYPTGKRVTLPRVFSHQDTSTTACPGALRERLAALRDLAVVGLGPAPVIAQVELTGSPVHVPTPLTIEARLTRTAAWTVTITDPSGAQVTQAAAVGTTPRIVWDGFHGVLPALPGSYRWSITADNGFHDVVERSGAFAVGLPLVS